ncbi:hypothetical protein ACIRL2_40415 [Embleya sp. NPDC127516]|uniref:hypothetical protein n=1 Tax=Embleya sp. NPDC127516 TaxID=3363990 RepID=UPI00381FE92F
MLLVRGDAVRRLTLEVLDGLNADDAAGGGSAAEAALTRISAEAAWGTTVAAWADLLARLDPTDRDHDMFGDGSAGVDRTSRNVARGLVDAAACGEEFALIAAREALLKLSELHPGATT